MLTKIKGPLFVFLSAVLYGSYGVWAVLLGDEFGIFFQAYARAIMILIVLIPICLLTNKWVAMKWSDVKHFGWCSGFLIFSQAPVYYAYQHAGVAVTSLIFFGSYVVAAYIVGYLLLKEKMSMIKILSLILAILGLHMVFRGSLGTFSLLALTMAAVGGISGGGGMSATKMIPKRFSAMQILIITWGLSVMTNLPASLIVGELQLMPMLDISWLILVGFAASGALAAWLLVVGLKHIDASLGGLISLLEIVVAVLFGFFIFSETIYLSTLLGALVIIIAAAMPRLTVAK